MFLIWDIRAKREALSENTNEWNELQAGRGLFPLSDEAKKEYNSSPMPVAC